MILKVNLLIVIIYAVCLVEAQLDEGDLCTLSDNSQGICKRLRTCSDVYQALLSGKLPENICGYKQFEPIVCCNTNNNNNNNVISVPSVTSTERSDSDSKWRPLKETGSTTDSNWQTSKFTTEQTIATRYDTSYTPVSRKKGALAKEKCAEYARSLYNSILPPTLAGNKKPVIESLCGIKSQKLIVGGTKAAPKEFPFMAAVGYNANSNSQSDNSEEGISWLCGGTLVSENYVLSAAHCTYSPSYGYAAWIKVGDLNLVRNDDNARPQLRKIVQSIRHPQYKKPLEYHDIALLKMEYPVTFDSWVRPACLPTIRGSSTSQVEGDNRNRNNSTMKAIATGWGRVDWADDEGSSDLLKVILPIVDHKKCNESFTGGVIDYKVKYGIIDEWQICAGEEGKDTCQGDSGGPLVIYNNNHKCMYDAIGITSLGRLCGSIIPGVYTRVDNYISWLEETIWN